VATKEPFDIEWGKLGILLTIVIGVIVLMALERIDPVAGAGMLGMMIGYTTGNGRLASKGSPTVPMIGRRPTPEEPPQ
jgi:hypothetical protein